MLATIKNLISNQASKKVYRFLQEYSKPTDAIFITATHTRFNIEALPNHTYQQIINLKRINDFLYINKYLYAVNQKLPIEGYFVGCVETYQIRKMRILKKYWTPFNYIYYFFDVLLTRVSPKLKLTKNLYFFLTKRKRRVISRTEALGRLQFAGFEIVKEKKIDSLLYFVAKKTKAIDQLENKNYGLLVTLNRIGQHGKTIQVYKLRTMHPYAEYIQQYVYEKSDLKAGGKLNNDFRISRLGAFMRKYWIDELPMLINLLKGEMKLIGVRPLSAHYLSLYTDEVRNKRLQTKPGLLPPFYADMPKTLEEILASEKKYLDAYAKKPFRTDVYYFFKILQTIILKGKRSA